MSLNFIFDRKLFDICPFLTIGTGRKNLAMRKALRRAKIGGYASLVFKL